MVLFNNNVNKKDIKHFLTLILIMLILVSLTACAGSDKELVDYKKQVDMLKAQNDTLKAENERLKAENERLQQELSKVQNKSDSVSEDSFSKTSNSLSEEYKTVNIGDTIVFSDVAEVIIEKCEFTKKVLPSKPEGIYSYYEAKDADTTYFHVVGKYKNLTTEEEDFDDIPIKFEAMYQNKYKYTGFNVAEESGGGDFDLLAYAKPMINLKFHVLIEVPIEVKDNGDFDLYIFKGDTKYKLKVQ